MNLLEKIAQEQSIKLDEYLRSHWIDETNAHMFELEYWKPIVVREWDNRKIENTVKLKVKSD